MKFSSEIDLTKLNNNFLPNTELECLYAFKSYIEDLLLDTRRAYVIDTITMKMSKFLEPFALENRQGLASIRPEFRDGHLVYDAMHIYREKTGEKTITQWTTGEMTVKWSDLMLVRNALNMLIEITKYGIIKKSRPVYKCMICETEEGEALEWV